MKDKKKLLLIESKKCLMQIPSTEKSRNLIINLSNGHRAIIFLGRDVKAEIYAEEFSHEKI